MKNILFISLIFLTFGCKNETEKSTPKEGEENLEINFELFGKIAGANNQAITIEAMSQQGTIKIASSTTNADGTFNLKGNIKGMGLYQMRVGIGNKVIPLTIEPNDKVEIQAKYENFERLPIIKGTKWAKAITEYMRLFNEFADFQAELMNRTDLTEEQQIAEFLRMRQPIDAFAAVQIEKDPSNPANIVLSTSLTPAMGFENWNHAYLDILKKAAFAFMDTYQDSPIAASMANQVQQIEAGYQEYLANAKSANAKNNQTAPEIALKNPDGKTIRLSSLKGKIVLIDFWASWCGPCRKENPNVVAVYNKYKDKGFTVFSVSLDKDAEAWKRAIKADGLIWPNHVSDLLQWDSPMPQLYGFQGIPYTVLIDQQGKIIGTNLRGPSLEQKLKEVLAKK